MTEPKDRSTVVMVSHNAEGSAGAADRTALLLDGEVVGSGPTRRILITPKDQRTEGYVTRRFS